MKSDDLQRALYFWAYQKNHKYICPNKFLDLWFECDMLSITNSDYLHEYEIKISRSDFKADFKKLTKHAKLSGEQEIIVEKGHIKCGKRMGIPYRDMGALFEDKIFSSYRYDLKSLITPAYFWFVTPVGLVKMEEIPSYSGWIEVREDGYVCIKKQAKRLHNNKVDSECKVKILESMAIRYWRLKLGIK